jgi:hypothetical protein
MDEHTKSFKVDENINQVLNEKYGRISTEMTEFEVDSNRVLIQKRVADLLNINAEQTQELFKALCQLLIKVCYENRILCEKLDVVVFTDDELKRGLQTKGQLPDGTFKGVILIPSVYLQLDSPFWNYAFLHELAHCWSSIEYPQDESFLPDYELMMDLLAICALRKIVSPHKKAYREIINHMTYIGSVGRKHLGKKLQEDILREPEFYLRNLLVEMYDWKEKVKL